MKIKQNAPFKFFLFMLSAAVILSCIPQEADARRGHASVHRGGGGHRNVNRNVNVNRNTNRNRNTNVRVNRNRNVNVNVNHRRGYGYHPVARGVAIGATAAVTAAVVGSMIYSLPPNCVTIVRYGTSYRQCGDVWYEPRYSGNNVTYIVVNPM